MRQFTPEEIRQAVRGRWRWPARQVTMKGVSIDSRTAEAGELFVALRGETFDGHDYVGQAADAGCIAAIVGWDVPLSEELLSRFGGGVIGVTDTTVALCDIAAHCRSHLAASVIAVTGSNGKTTVKGMIHHILSRRLRGSASPKSFNNAVGVPLTLFAAAPEDDYVICEVGSNAKGEVAALSRVVQPHVAVITSIAQTHLQGLTDLEHVAIEKAALLGGLAAPGLAVIWADSELLARAVRGYDVRVIRFGAADEAELRLTACEPVPGGVRFQINGRQWVDLPIPGRHNAFNAMAAMAVARRFGFEQADAADALADYPGAEMRLEPVKAGEVTIINDAYNSNPVALAAAVDALDSFDGKRRVAVVGDMLELGPDSDGLHEAAGRDLARGGIALVVGVGPLGGRIADGAEAEGAAVARMASVQQAARMLPGLLRDGDLVLLKGSRAMRMERLAEPIRSKFASTGKKTAAARAQAGRASPKRTRRKC